MIANLGGDTLTYMIESGAQVLDQGTAASLSDADNPANLNGGNVTVSIVANRQADEDVLSVRNQGMSAGQIGVLVNNISYGVEVIGTWAGGTGNDDLVITLNGNATLTNVGALLRNLTYNNNSAEPSTSARTVRMTVNDGAGGTSADADITVNLTNVNSAPTLTATAANPTYLGTGGAPTAVLFTAPSASTVEAGQAFTSMTLTVTGLADGTHEKLVIDGSTVQLTTGAMPGVTGTNSLQVSVALVEATATVTITDPSPSLNASELQTLVSDLAYYNTSTTPTGGPRVVTITQLKDDGGTDNSGADTATLTLASTVTVQPLPAVTSATYNATSGVLVVTGTNFAANGGAETLDVDVSALTLTGEGDATRTLTASSDVEIDSATQFTVTLHATDKAAVNLILNKNGSASTGGTTYNLAVADNFITAVTTGNSADATSGVTVSEVAPPAISSAIYDYSANTLTLTGTGFLFFAENNDIDVSTFTLTGEGGASYTLDTSADVEITSGTSATITLTGADVPQVEALLNKNGATSATSATTYNLAVVEDWNRGADTTADIADDTIPVTVTNYASPTITSATYDANAGALVVTGTNFVAASGATNDVDVSLLTVRGGADETYTLTDSADVEVTSATEFTVTLSATDKLSVNGVLHKNGTESGSASVTLYNLEAADNWMTASPAANDIADTTLNGITVSNTQSPTITSVTYARDTGVVVVTGTNFVRKPGAANDVDLEKLMFRGYEDETHSPGPTTGVEITSATSFTFTLSGTDKTEVDAVLNQHGTTASDNSTYNLAAEDNWLRGADPSANIQDLTNGITVSNPPSITSATYDALEGKLVVTGANFLANSIGFDIDASKFTLTGEGGATYTLTDTPNVELESGEIALTLGPTDKAAVNQILNKDGTESTGGTDYNLKAADDYLMGLTEGNIADDTIQTEVNNVPAPTITSATYNVTTGVLAVTGTGFVKFVGENNDVDVSKLTVLGEGGATRTLTSSNVEITSGTAFSVTLNADDQEALIPLLNKDGTISIGLTTYNLAAAEDWAAGADPAVTIGDTTGNGITVSNADATAPTVSGVTSSTENGRYKAGVEISIQVNFSENVYVTGTPRLTLETGATDRIIDFTGGSGTSSLTFTYTVQAGDASTDLNYVATNSLALNGGTIKDRTGNNATLTLASPGAANSLGTNKNIVIDNTPPTVSSIVRASGSTVHTAGSTITYRVTFDGGVTGVDVTDFTLTAPTGNTPASTATGTVASVTEQSAGVYDVVVNAVSGQGKARLDLKSTGTGIADLAGNAIADGGFTTGEFYFVGATSVFDSLSLVSDGTAPVNTAETPSRTAQRFTVPAGQSVTLTSVVLRLKSVNATPTPVVQIYTNNAGTPGTAVGDAFTNPSGLTTTELNVWTGSVTLAPETTYWIVFASSASSYGVDISASTSGGSGAWLTGADYKFRWGVNMGSETGGALHLALGVASVPSITSSLTASGTYRTAFTYNTSASNSPTSYAATGLPAGLTIDTATGVISGSPTQTGSFNVSLTATNGNGTSTPATLVLTIGKATLTVTADSQSRSYGSGNHPLTVSYSGFLGSDNAASLTTQPTATTAANAGSAVGTYAITASGGVSDNYAFTYVPGVLTVTTAPQTINFPTPADLLLGQSTTLSATANSGLPVSFSVISGPATVSGATLSTTGVGSVTVRASQGGNENYDTAPNADRSFNVLVGQPTVTTPEQVPVPPLGGTAQLVVTDSNPNLGYQWQRNGSDLPSSSGSSLSISDIQPTDVGLYTYSVTLPGGGTGTSEPVIVGLTSTELVVGTGDLVGSDIVHPNGNVYDQVLLEGPGASVTASTNKVTRLSFVDLTNDIVQVEFSGAGTLSVVMDDPSQPAPPINYNQENVDYVRGHLGIVITGANETSNLSVFSVGPVTAVNQSLFKEGVTYDGVADVAFVAIQSANGKFGGIRTGNVNYYASQGFTGVYAPGVEFAGPINIGEVTAFDSATPVLVFGNAGTVNITGGNLAQDNGSPVAVSGITKVQFVDGQTSQGVTLPAQQNQGVLTESGVNVTSQIVVNP